MNRRSRVTALPPCAEPAPDEATADEKRMLLGGILVSALIPACVGLFVTVPHTVRVLAVAQAAYAAFASLLLSRKRCGMPPHGPTLLGLFALGTTIGASYVVVGDNSMMFWGIYSLLTAAWLVALVAGWRLSRVLDARSLSTAIVLLCIGDLVMLGPRSLLGFDVRNGMGTTGWLGALLVVRCILPSSGFLLGVAPIPLIAVGCGAAMLSGSRTTVILTAVSLCAAIIYLFRARKILRIRLDATVAFGAVLMLPVAVVMSQLSSDIESQMSLVSARVQVTLLNEDEFSLDEGGRGREVEADSALREFERRADVVSWAFGLGHGFSYVTGAPGDVASAHVHITPVAFLVRYGLVGVGVLALMFLSTLRSFLRASLAPPTTTMAIDWAVQMTTVSLWVSSLVSGMLVNPMAWLLIGMSSGLARKAEEGIRAASNGQTRTLPAVPPSSLRRETAW